VSALRRIRVDARLTIPELATKSGVLQETIRDIETGRSENPRPATLGKLADALSTSEHTVRPSDIDPFVASESSAA
jgi:transcriptional regulator with XRE-family HTH domain